MYFVGDGSDFVLGELVLCVEFMGLFVSGDEILEGGAIEYCWRLACVETYASHIASGVKTKIYCGCYIMLELMSAE